jgi:cobalt-zinc-cadmium efflux system outer membrane protein
MKLCIFCLAIAFASSASAQTKEAKTEIPNLTLDELVSEALEKNPELNFYKAQIAAARAERHTSGLISNPELSTQLGSKRARDAQSGLTGEGLAWSVAVLQPFEYPGRLALRKAIANKQIELAEIGYAQFRSALLAKVRSLAYGVFIAQQKEQATREVADRFQALIEVLVQRETAGVTPLLETRIIEANAITAQRRASEAVQIARSAMLELNQLRGQSPGEVVRLSSIEFSFHRPEPLDKLLALADTNSFELRMRLVELEQQGFKLSLAKNERFPSISMGPFYSEEQTGRVGEKDRTVGLGVSLPLPLWNRNAGKIESEHARREQAEVSLLVTKREIERKVVQHAQTYEAKLAEMSRWRPEASAQLQDAAELADRNYRLGAVPVAIYVELQKQYLEAIEALLETRKEALEAAQQLEILTGSALYGTVAEKKPEKP